MPPLPAHFTPVLRSLSSSCASTPLRICPFLFKTVVNNYENVVANSLRENGMRSHFTIPCAKLSPTHTTSTITSWSQSISSEVECYDLLYTVAAKNVEKFGDVDESQEMVIETCDDGYLAVIFESASGEVEPGAPIGIIAEDEEELDSIQNLSQSLSPVEFEKEMIKTSSRPINWHAYLGGKKD